MSPRYAKEIQSAEFGYGLEGFLRTRAQDLTGILNGIDRKEWNPATDSHIEARYGDGHGKGMAGKARCKRALQERCGFPKTDAVLFGMVSRLVWEKGIDILLDALPGFVERDAQLVVLGTGDERYCACQSRWCTLPLAQTK